MKHTFSLKHYYFCIFIFLLNIFTVNSQCPDLTLPVQGDDVCINDYATVTIENTESDVYYQAYKGGNIISGVFKGNGNNLNIIIPAIQLDIGINDIHFKAFRNPAGPSNVAIYETNTPPALDGITDESDWYLLGPYPNKKWGDPPPETAYNGGWGGLYDNNYLYLGARIQDGSPPSAPITDTTTLHRNDAVEFVIQAGTGVDQNGDGTDDEGIKLIVDCDGQASQQIVPYNGNHYPPIYDHVAYKDANNVWSVEIRLAWADLGYAGPPSSMKFDAYLDFAEPGTPSVGQRNWTNGGSFEDISKAGTIDLVPGDTCDVDLINTATITVFENPSANITPGNQEICGGDVIALNGGPTGGTTPYQDHTWTGNTSPLSSTKIVNPDFSTTTAGMYNLTYTVTDDIGCTGSDTVSIEVVAQANLVITDPDPACPSVDLTDTAVTDGSTGGVGVAGELLDKSTWTASSDMTWHGDVDGSEGTIDGNLTTYFHAQPRSSGKINYLTIDMQSVWDVGQIDVTTGTDAFTDGVCEIYFSDDNSTWIKEGEFTATANSTETNSLSGASGRYVKFQMTTTVDKDYWDIVEIDFYEPGSGYTYWKDPAATDTLHNPDSVTVSGTYYIKAGVDPCSDIKPVNVSLNCVCPDSLITGYTVSPATCHEGNDGAILITTGLGTSPYKLEWSTSNGSGLIAGSKNQTTLTPGNYQLIVRDNGGCADTSTYTITDPDSMAISTTITDASCEGDSDGEIVIDNVTGGNGAPYSYLWDNSTNNSSISNLAKGTYYVTVYDTENCPKVDSFEVQDGANLPNADLTPSDTTICAGEPVTLTATGGISQSWADGSFPNPRTVSPTEDTTYYAIISDGMGCNATRSATITVTPDPTVNLGDDRALCEGNTLLLDAGSHDSYLWNNFETTQTIEVSDSGMYHVTVENTSGCTSSDTIHISFAPTPEANIVIQQGSTSMCQGRPLVLNGTSTNAVTYIWQPDGTNDAILDKEADITTTYRLTVFSAQGCTDTASVTINVTPAPTPEITGDNTVFTETTGEVYELVDGIESEVDSYTWTVNGGTITANNTGSIEVTWGSVPVTDAFVSVFAEDTPCSGEDTLWVSLTPPPPLRIYLSATNISCHGYNDGSITVIFDDDSTGIGEGIPENYDYNWSDGSFGNNQTISSLSQGEYSVTVTDGRRTDSAKVIINEPELLEITSIDIKNVRCHGENNGSIEISDTGGTPGYTYFYSEQDSDTTYQTSSSLIDSLYAETYYITLQDANQCEDTTSAVITQPPPIRIEFTIDQPTCDLSTDGSITLDPHGGTPVVFGFDSTYSYIWSEQDNFNDNVLEEIGPGQYTAIVIDSEGCDDTLTLSLTPERKLCVFIPTAFSPNQDEINDKWEITFFQRYYPKGIIYVYDRWGELIYKSEKGYREPWDGTYKGMPLPVDSYHFIIELNNGKDGPRVGQVTIIK